MSIKSVLFYGATLAVCISLSAFAAEPPKPAKPQAAPAKPQTVPVKSQAAPAKAKAVPTKPQPVVAKPEFITTKPEVLTEPELKVKAAYEASEAAAKEAEAAVAPLRTAMQQADTAYAAAKKTADTKRQQATDAKNLSGDVGVAELKQAEENVPVAIKALDEAAKAKPLLEKAAADAKAAVVPLQQAYDAAEKSAKESAAAAKVALEAANKVVEEAKRAMAAAAGKRRSADSIKATRMRAEQGEQISQKQIAATTRRIAEAKAQVDKHESEKLTAAAEQKLAQATAQKTLAETALANFKAQKATAAAAIGAAEKTAQEFAKMAEQKNQAAAQVLAKRKAMADTAAAIVQAQQVEQQAQTLFNTASRKAAAAPKAADAAKQKKVAEAGLAAAKKQVAAAMAAEKAAQDAAKDILPLENANKQAAADAAAKRKAADMAKNALNPVRQKMEQSLFQANAAGQALTRAEARKKSSEEALANLKERIAAAKKNHQADEQAAKAAEAAALPFKAEADKTRAAYAAATKTADEKRALAEQAKTNLYRLIAARQVASLAEIADPPQPANRIDELVLAKLKTLNIQPVLCSDAVFIRRAYLDLTGKLPTADEAREFIKSTDKNKRVALINRLLEDTAHIDYWAMRWSDILRVKAEFPVKVWPNAAQAYHRWVWESIAQNKRFDRFARELLISSGSNFRVGPVNFYRAIQDKTPEGIASVTALAFMGTRIHLWPEARRNGMAVFFSQVGYKPTSEWKEEIVFWDPLKSAALAGSTAAGVDAVAKSVTATNQIPQALPAPMEENAPLTAVLPDGVKVTIPADRDPREVFADWLIRPENPWFTKNIVNRTWSWAMGRGIVHEPDDQRDDNPPSNPELLAYLQKELVSSGYDVKHLKRLIFTSATYQFSSIARFKSPEARANFASYPLRRVEAEVLNDALNTITGSTDLYTSAVPEPFSYIPKDMNAVEVADGSITSSFLTLFGRSARATGMETERVNELASTQWLFMLNSAEVQNKLQTGPKLTALLASGGKPNEIAEKLYLTILSRFPTDADLRAVDVYGKMGASRGREMWIDLAWALVNSPEFLLRH